MISLKIKGILEVQKDDQTNFLNIFQNESSRYQCLIHFKMLFLE